MLLSAINYLFLWISLLWILLFAVTFFSEYHLCEFCFLRLPFPLWISLFVNTTFVNRNIIFLPRLPPAISQRSYHFFAVTFFSEYQFCEFCFLSLPFPLWIPLFLKYHFCSRYVFLTCYLLKKLDFYMKDILLTLKSDQDPDPDSHPNWHNKLDPDSHILFGSRGAADPESRSATLLFGL